MNTEVNAKQYMKQMKQHILKFKKKQHLYIKLNQQKYLCFALTFYLNVDL